MTKSKRQHLDEKIDSLDDSTRGQERVAAPGDKSKKKKKRKRKSKKNKRKKDNTDESSSLPVTKKIKVADEKKDESSSDLPPDSLSEVPLEGSMIGGTMVLINRKEGKVYSALERLENGNLKEIGIVSKKDGSVILYKSEINDDNVQSEGNKKPAADFPFPTDADDHCESPVHAYSDILPFLKDAATKTSQEKLLIYDPYFCNGTVVKNLKSLGFPNVYNRKEDCYQVWGTSRYPLHDVLVTNPPYSGDHIERLINHVTSKDFGNRPWMLLLPQWVHKKDYYIAKTKGIRPFYIVPHKRYVYIPPPSFRESKKSDVHKKSSPFVSMWFIWGGTEKQNDRWLSRIARKISTVDVARSKSALRDLRRKKG